jgi:hypothetical protein
MMNKTGLTFRQIYFSIQRPFSKVNQANSIRVKIPFSIVAMRGYLAFMKIITARLMKA